MASKPSFGAKLVPFLFMIGFGSWGLSQFLVLPTRLKDDRIKRKKQGREKFSLEKENERLEQQLKEKGDNYDYVAVPGPKDPNRRPAP